ASDGGVFSFGDANFYGSVPGRGIAPDDSPILPRLNAPIVGMVPSYDGRGYFLVAAGTGAVYAFGDATNYGGPASYLPYATEFLSAVRTPSGNGYWILFSNG